MSNVTQAQALQLAEAVNTAYTAYAQLFWWQRDEAAKLIASLQPGYSNINPIWVWETMPDYPSYPTWDPATPKPKPNPNDPKPPKDFLGSVTGSQLFGFTATIASSGINILILRGTVTPYEAGASLWNWDTTSQLSLPTPGEGKAYNANIKASFWEFYQGTDNVGVSTGLAASIKTAISAVNAVSTLPWYASAHSLGGGMLSLAVVDALSDQTFSAPPTVVTFGSVVVGDQGWAELYNSQVSNSVRIANLCDFVPSLRSLLPGVDTVTYQHVGDTWAFVWQTNSDWGNHNMQSVYGQIVASQRNFGLIYQEPDPNMELLYPVGIAPQSSGAVRKGKGA